jgi:hypothetical protein
MQSGIMEALDFTGRPLAISELPNNAAWAGESDSGRRSCDGLCPAYLAPSACAEMIAGDSRPDVGQADAPALVRQRRAVQPVRSGQLMAILVTSERAAS